MHEWKVQSMSEYNRTTGECRVSQLHPEVVQALRNFFQQQQLGDLEAETLRCCETTSRKKNSNGLFSRWNASQETTVHTAILLTSQWLIWVRKGPESGTQLTAARLNQISVREYKSLFTSDTGLEVSGYIEGSKSPVRGYIGMGPESATQKFCDEVRQAIDRVNPPVQKIWPKWLGG